MSALFQRLVMVLAQVLLPRLVESMTQELEKILKIDIDGDGQIGGEEKRTVDGMVSELT